VICRIREFNTTC